MTKHSHLPKTGATASTAKLTMPSSAAQPWPVKDFIGLLRDLSIFFGLSVMFPTLLLRSLGAQSLDWIILPLGAAFFGPLITQMVLLDHRKTYIDSLEREAKLAAENSIPKPLSWDEQKKENLMKSAEDLESARKAYEGAQEQHRVDRAGYFNRNRQHGTLLDAFKLMHFLISDDLLGGLRGVRESVYSLFEQLSEKIDLACDTESHTDTDSNEDVLQHPHEHSDACINDSTTARQCGQILEQKVDDLLELVRKSGPSNVGQTGPRMDHFERFQQVKPDIQEPQHSLPEASSPDTRSDQPTPKSFSTCTLIRNISKPNEKEVLTFDKDTGEWRSDQASRIFNSGPTTASTFSDLLKAPETDPHTDIEPSTDHLPSDPESTGDEHDYVVGWDNDAGGIFRTRAAKVGGDQKGWDDSSAW